MEEYIISKKDLEKYFNNRKIISKKELEWYYKNVKYLQKKLTHF